MAFSLAQLVRKWFKTANHRKWFFEFSYVDGTQDLRCGYIHLENSDLVIFVDKNEACLGRWSCGDKNWSENQYSATKIQAADPRFFTKLDRLMRFAQGIDKRLIENQEEFYKAEHRLMNEILG